MEKIIKMYEIVTNFYLLFYVLVMYIGMILNSSDS